MNTLEQNNEQFDLRPLLSRYQKAKARRQNWKAHWQDCYEYALPQRSHSSQFGLGQSRTNTLYDGTAMDAVDQLAASMLANLTPPWAQWFGFKPGPDLNEEEAQAIKPTLEDIGKKIQSHLDRSNFSVEMHQCFLDLAVGGTATLQFEETKPGAYSAFKFSAVPLQDIVLEEGDNGFLNGSYQSLSLTLGQIQDRYGLVDLPLSLLEEAHKDPQATFDVLETVLPNKNTFAYRAILMDDKAPTLLKEGIFEKSPSISFRWMKSPGEIYGRSPVMKALPDIKTANKVVELILKNASIAVTGIWQADDDGVLNPANIELKPGSIIPKAVGSQGLKPLDMPGRFDVSELVLNDLRARIRHALMVDKLGPVVSKKMSATEVLERSQEMVMLLGATYGRLQSELLTPLIERAFSILKRRGEIPDLELDGRFITMEYRSPLSQSQGQRDVQNILIWLDAVKAIGVEASQSVNVEKIVKVIADSLSIPNELVRETAAMDDVIEDIAPLMKEEIDA